MLCATILFVCFYALQLHRRSELLKAKIAEAISSVHCKELKSLAVSSNQWHIVTPYGETVVMAASRCGDAGLLRVALANRVDVNAADVNGKTALQYAVQSERAECVRILLESRADVNASDAHDYSTMHYAAATGDLLIIRDLVNHGGDVNAQKNGGPTPLITALRFGRYKAARLLIDLGADVDRGTRRGVTAFTILNDSTGPGFSNRNAPGAPHPNIGKINRKIELERKIKSRIPE